MTKKIIEKYGINKNIPFIGANFPSDNKELILEKLLEAHELAKINVQKGNITNRGFGVNICTNDDVWIPGTNFNNTRNDISSICAERSAIIAAYNNMLLNYPQSEIFKIKYIVMAQNDSLNEIKKTTIPCEDCLSWLNTDKYFSDKTIIFTFENYNNNLAVRLTTLKELLPYRNAAFSNKYSADKKIIFSERAKKSFDKFNFKKEDIYNILKINYSFYKNNTLANISNQNIVCSIIANGKIFSAKKLDWTRRWFVEPLEICAYDAIREFGDKTKINLISYFGDNYCENNGFCHNDGVISIKTIGRIRQKYADFDTILLLNYEDKLELITVSDYLPKKFIQGYEIK